MQLPYHAFEQFYQTPLGKHTALSISKTLKTLWPELSGTDHAALGYAMPILPPAWFDEGGRMLIGLPKETGEGKFKKSEHSTAVIDQENLPFSNENFDRLLLVHSLEFADHRRKFLQECWRVLRAEGRMIVIVPSRRGLWVRNGTTPFGQGNPFNRAQLTELLGIERFETLTIRRALYFPPVQNKVALSLWRFLEFGLASIAPHFGGVLIIEVKKQLFSAVTVPATSALEKFIPQSMPVSVPVNYKN